MTVGEARKIQPAFGDPKAIEARDLLRLVDRYYELCEQFEMKKASIGEEMTMAEVRREVAVLERRL